MSGAVSASTLAMMGAGIAGGMMLSGALTPKMPTPNIQAPEKPPQASKAPERAPAGVSNAAITGMSGNASTFLTGPSGINPASLSLGQNTLLGR